MQLFVIVEEHLKLLSKLCVEWEDGAYCGAPSIDIKRPYGNSDVYADVAEIIGLERVEDDDGETYWPKGTKEKCKLLHEDMATVLQICVHNVGKIEPGSYSKEQYGGTWKKL